MAQYEAEGDDRNKWVKREHSDWSGDWKSLRGRFLCTK